MAKRVATTNMIATGGIAARDAERRFRTLFISDVHLGSKGCQANRLLEFIRYHEAETIYLVGTSSTAGVALELVLAARAQRRGPEVPAQGAQGRAHRLHPRQPRRVSARLLRRISAASRWSSTPFTWARMDGAISSCMATISISWSHRHAGSRFRQQGFDVAILANRVFNALAGGSAFPIGRSQWAALK